MAKAYHVFKCLLTGAYMTGEGEIALFLKRNLDPEFFVKRLSELKGKTVLIRVEEV